MSNIAGMYREGRILRQSWAMAIRWYLKAAEGGNVTAMHWLGRIYAGLEEYPEIFLRGLGKLIAGDVPRNQIAGPIGIAEIAGKSLERGWLDYLHTLILISINLGILNLLPIPVLDGGQALVFAIEGIRRAPLSLRTRGFVQQLGVTMLLLIMGLAFWNDISRNWIRVVDWWTGG